MTEYTPRVWSLGEVCRHGSLGRQCETCQAQHERDWALAEVDRLAAQLDAVRAAFGHGADQESWRPGETLGEAVARLVDQLDEARGVLSDVQWGSRNCCPECGRHLYQGHAPNCRLAAVLRGRG